MASRRQHRLLQDKLTCWLHHSLRHVFKQKLSSNICGMWRPTPKYFIILLNYRTVEHGALVLHMQVAPAPPSTFNAPADSSRTGQASDAAQPLEGSIEVGQASSDEQPSENVLDADQAAEGEAGSAAGVEAAGKAAQGGRVDGTSTAEGGGSADVQPLAEGTTLLSLVQVSFPHSHFPDMSI